MLHLVFGAAAIQGKAQVDYDLERVIHSLGHDHVPSEWLKVCSQKPKHKTLNTELKLATPKPEP
jgi:hypothetical protein